MVVGAWAYLIGTGSISTIWPMFGAANQLLGTLALCIGTTVLDQDVEVALSLGDGAADALRGDDYIDRIV